MAEEFVLKRGSTGAVMVATLKDAAGAVDLTGWTIKLTLKLGNSAVPQIDESDCVVDPDQVANKGKVRHLFDETNCNIPKGVYNAEFKATDPNGEIHYFPTEKNNLYERVIVQDSLS